MFEKENQFGGHAILKFFPHAYLKNKLSSLQAEVSSKTEMQEKFSKEIDEISQETEELVEEIEKWQT